MSLHNISEQLLLIKFSLYIKSKYKNKQTHYKIPTQPSQSHKNKEKSDKNLRKIFHVSINLSYRLYSNRCVTYDSQKMPYNTKNVVVS